MTLTIDVEKTKPKKSVYLRAYGIDSSWPCVYVDVIFTLKTVHIRRERTHAQISLVIAGKALFNGESPCCRKIFFLRKLVLTKD